MAGNLDILEFFPPEIDSMKTDYTSVARAVLTSLTACILTNSLLGNDPAIPRREKYLLLDSRLLSGSEGAVLKPGEATKYSGNPLFKEEFEWEPRFDNMYPNVIWDEEEKIFKCWYSPFIVSNVDLEKSTSTFVVWINREMAVCYATSKDGIKWEKPMMNICPWNGGPSNIVFREAHGAGVFKDEREKDPRRRYKMFFRHDTAAGRVVSVTFSPDGLHWEQAQKANATARADTHNNALWAPTLNKYVAFTREWTPITTPPGQRERLVARTQSDNFVDWEKPEIVMRGVEPHLQTYSMPVMFYHDVYLGFPALFNTVTDRVQTEFAWSRDTQVWERVSPGQAMVAPSSRHGDFDWGCVYVSKPVFLPNEVRLYYGGTDSFHFGARKGYFAFASLRPDGFAGWEAKEGEQATVLTKPVNLRAGERVCVTADLKSGGELEVALVNPTTKAVVDKVVILSGARALTYEPVLNAPTGTMETAPLQVRFRFRRGTLYAFSAVR
jgi:hypothetical protein